VTIGELKALLRGASDEAVVLIAVPGAYRLYTQVQVAGYDIVMHPEARGTRDLHPFILWPGESVPRPHEFRGRIDRVCEVCGRSDRDPIHVPPPPRPATVSGKPLDAAPSAPETT
jgi:hypothetical protein